VRLDHISPSPFDGPDLQALDPQRRGQFPGQLFEFHERPAAAPRGRQPVTTRQKNEKKRRNL